MSLSIVMIKIVLLRLFSFVGYCVFYSTLTLFLLSTGLDKSTVVLYTSSFLALNYFVTLVGGWFLPWIYDYKKLFIVAGIFYLLGAYLFFISHVFILGLSLFVMGSLLFDSTFILVVTRLFEHNKPLLQKGLFMGYLGMNLAGLIGFGLAGWFQKTGANWPIVMVLLLCFCGIVLTLASTWKTWPVNPAVLKRSLWLRAAMLLPFLLTGCILYGLFSFQVFIQPLVVSIWVLVFVGLVILSLKNNPESAGMRQFLQLVLIYLIFISIYYLIPTLILLFVAHNVTNELFGFEMTPAWFLNIMCIVVIFGMFWNAHRVTKRPFNLYRQFRLGMLLTAAAALSLFLGVEDAGNALIPLGFIVAYFVLQSIGEVAIAPISYSTVAEYIAIKHHHPYFIGFWLATYSIGMINSGLISAKIVPHLSLSLQDNRSYAWLFLGMTGCALLGFFISFFKTCRKPLGQAV